MYYKHIDEQYLKKMNGIKDFFFRLDKSLKREKKRVNTQNEHEKMFFLYIFLGEYSYDTPYE